MSPEFLSETWNLAFFGIGKLLNDPEWELAPEDAEELGNRTARWINSMDQRKAKKWLAKIGKHQHGLSLLFAATTVIAPRIAHTKAKRRLAKHAASKPLAPEESRTSRADIHASATTNDRGISPDGNDGVAGIEVRPVDTNVGIPGLGGTSISRQDAARLFAQNHPRNV